MGKNISKLENLLSVFLCLLFKGVVAVNVAWLEVLVVTLGMLVAPFSIWLTRSLRDSIINQVILILNEHYSSLENLIIHNKERTIYLESRLNHRAEIATLKFNSLVEKLNDIEVYLEKTNGYRRRGQISPVKSKEIDIQHKDDNDISMTF